MDYTSGKNKVVYYNHTGDVSGAEISLLLTISHMPDSVEAVLVAPEGELLERARKQGINVIPVKSHRARMSENVFTVLRGIVGTLTAGLRLRRVLATVHPEIVHANSIRAGLIAIVAVSGLKVKLLWHVRDNLPLNLVGRLIRWVAARRVQAVIAISKAIYENFATTQVLKDKARVVHNGIDTSLTGVSIRKDLGVPDNIFVVAVVGQIAPWKRQMDAIEAFAQLVSDHSDSELWIVGEPKFRAENIVYQKALLARADSLGLIQKTKFLGFRPDVMNVMASIDVLLVPSDNEPFGRVVIEAMLAGKPVIGAIGGGIPEIILHSETGYLVKIGDIPDIAKRISQLGSDRDNRITYGVQGRNRALEYFSIQQTVSGVSSLYMLVQGVYATRLI